MLFPPEYRSGLSTWGGLIKLSKRCISVQKITIDRVGMKEYAALWNDKYLLPLGTLAVSIANCSLIGMSRDLAMRNSGLQVGATFWWQRVWWIYVLHFLYGIFIFSLFKVSDSVLAWLAARKGAGYADGSGPEILTYLELGLRIEVSLDHRLKFKYLI